MSKRAVIWIVLLLLLLAGLMLSDFGRNLPFLSFRDPVFTEKIPKDRPKRLDRRLMERFTGEKTAAIISTILAERAAVAAPQDNTGPSQTQKLLSSLPNESIPYPTDAEPQDEAWLTEFVKTFQQRSDISPTEEELWQFNLALTALKIDPDQVPESVRMNTTPAPESDTFPIELAPRDVSFGAPFCMGDFKGEGSLQIITDGGTAAYRLDPSEGLSEIDWPPPEHPGDGLYPADYDHDDDLDLFITRKAGLPNTLLRNEGSGRFTDVTSEIGLLSFNTTTAAAWLDFNQDGLLDLLVGSEDHPLELYRQTELATFEPVAWDLKLWIPRGANQLEVADLNEDTFPDFFVGIDGLSDRLYLSTPANNWQSWRFKDISIEAGLPQSSSESCGTFFDFDNDGHLDLVTAINGELQLVRKNETGNFGTLGNEFVSLPPVKAATSLRAMDIDNDGFLDLAVGNEALQLNQFLWNRGGTGFLDISVSSKSSFLDEPDFMETGDFDGDGRSELIYASADRQVRWLEASGPVGNWLHLRSQVTLPRGTKLALESRDSDWILSTTRRILEFPGPWTIGVGEAKTIESLTVTLPDGSEPFELQPNLEPNQEFAIELPAPR